MKFNYESHYSSLFAIALAGGILFYFTGELIILFVFGSALVIGVVWERAGLFLDKIWKAISFVLSLIVPNILLSMIYFILLSPLAKLSKLFKKNDPLNLKNTKQSLWVKEEVRYLPDSFHKMW